MVAGSRGLAIMRTRSASTLAAAIAAVLHAPLAGAAVINVDHTTCTMANASVAANTDSASGGCTAGNGADTLRVVADFDNAAVLPPITSNVTIVGTFQPPTLFGVEGGPVFVVGQPATGGD